MTGRSPDSSARGYSNGSTSYVAGLMPSEALTLPVGDVLAMLRARLGDAVDEVCTGRALPADQSPTHGLPDTSWITSANVVGINVRTVGSFWRVVHYCLTVPGTVDAVHLLPIWEPGVVGSLYGIASWAINGEFFDAELAAECPGLDTVQKQLRTVVDILHLTGRAVGMEVIPHTDRFSEIVLANPSLFEWLKRVDKRITDHRSDLHEDVEQLIVQFIEEHGPAIDRDQATRGEGASIKDLFTEAWPEAERNRILFGAPEQPLARNERRGALIRLVHANGYEPVPATMAPPYRGIEVDPNTANTDSAGVTWVDYKITRPQPMSRVFGPLTRFKLFERKSDNRDWEIDFDRPRPHVWSYVADHYETMQRTFGFDFMRGDMSHVQMRPDGVPAAVPEYYDLLTHVKRRISARLPSFAYFAETFLSPPGVIAYGDEVDHLEASDADVTLGDLQSVPVASNEFSQRLRHYLDIAATRKVTPCFTLMTGDKDDPRFDEFYLAGNELRLFAGLLIPGMPSYVALGYELRDAHPERAANETYTKLYVFQQSSGRNATSGPYQFGSNTGLFTRLQRIHAYAEPILGQRHAGIHEWLLPPDPTGGRKVIAWVLTGEGASDRVCICNCDTVAPAANVKVPIRRARGGIVFEFSTVPDPATVEIRKARDGFHVARLGRGECRVYTVVSPEPGATHA